MHVNVNYYHQINGILTHMEQLTTSLDKMVQLLLGGCTLVQQFTVLKTGAAVIPW